MGKDPDLIPPRITMHSPDTDEVDVEADADITITFNEAIDVGTVTTNNILVIDSQTQDVAGLVNLIGGGLSIEFDPDNDLELGETYTVTVRTDVTDIEGNNLDGNGNGIFDGIIVDDYTFSFTVVPPKPPSILAIPELHPTEDVEYVLDLTPYISDEDTLITEVVLSENSSYAELDGWDLKMTYPNGVEVDDINLSADDGMFVTSGNIHVVVSTDNDKPILSEIPSQVAIEDVSLYLDLKDYITDIDTPYEDMTVTENSKYCKVEGLVLNMTYPDGVLEDLINVSIYDKGIYVYADIEVDVTPVNDAPVITGLPLLEIEEDKPYNISMTSYISDIDNEVADLIILENSEYAEVDGQFIWLTYPEGILSDGLNIIVSDGEKEGNATLQVTILPVNDPPKWIGEVAIEATEDVPGEYDLAQHLNDTDTEFSLLRVTSDSRYGHVDDNIFKFNYPDGVLLEVVTFSLSDREFKADLLVNVTITPVNDLPDLAEPKVDPTTGNKTTEFSFTVLYTDVDTTDKDPAVQLSIDGELNDCVLISGYNNKGATYRWRGALDPGNHTWKFVCKDPDGAEAETEERILTVDADLIIDGDDDDDTDETAFASGGLIFGIIGAIMLIIVIIIVVVLVLVVVMRKKKAPEEQTAQPTTPEDAPPAGPQQVQGTAQPMHDQQQMQGTAQPLQNDPYAQQAQYPQQQDPYQQNTYGKQNDPYGQQGLYGTPEQQVGGTPQPQQVGGETQQSAGLGQQESNYLPPAQEQPPAQDPYAGQDMYAQPDVSQQPDQYAQPSDIAPPPAVNTQPQSVQLQPDQENPYQ